MYEVHVRWCVCGRDNKAWQPPLYKYNRSKIVRETTPDWIFCISILIIIINPLRVKGVQNCSTIWSMRVVGGNQVVKVARLETRSVCYFCSSFCFLFFSSSHIRWSFAWVGVDGFASAPIRFVLHSYLLFLFFLSSS